MLTKKVRIVKEVEELAERLSQASVYHVSTIRNIALLFGIEKLAYILSENPEPFHDNVDFWFIYHKARKAVEELEEKKAVTTHA